MHDHYIPQALKTFEKKHAFGGLESRVFLVIKHQV